MADRRLSLFTEMTWPRAAAALCCVLLLALSSCGGSAALNASPATQVPPRISAAWLDQQPGPRLGGFGFHLLDAQARPLAFPRELTLSAADAVAGAPRFRLELQSGGPEDIYLYVTYDPARFVYDAAQLDPARAAQYLLLAVPQRIPGVLTVGIARCGERGQPAAAGALAEISFAAGAEHVYRGVSAVNSDPASAAVLSAVDLGGGTARLSWDERNIGDYNNNSQVEIADLTPVGLYFGQQVAQAPVPAQLELVDGDANGEINVADLTPIGRNFLRYLQAYTVYYAHGENPPPAAFEPLSFPTLARLPLYEAATAEQRKQRLHYTYDAPLLAGANHFYVRAFADDDGSPSEGPPSNTASLTAQVGNQPPYWESSVGLLSATGSGLSGIRVSFGRAVDPEGGPVSYILRYVLGDQQPGVPGTLSVTIPSTALTGFPPYSWVLEGLSPGQLYTLNLQAEDTEGARTANTDTLSASPPLLAISDDSWPCQRHDPARSGCNPDCTLTEPLTPDFSALLDWEMAFDVANEPLISSAGWITAALGGDAGLRRFSLPGGAQLDTFSGLASADGFNGALFGSRIVTGAAGGLALYREGYGAALPINLGTQVSAGVLLLGDFVFCADRQGLMRCLIAESGEEIWHWPVSVPGVPYYMSPASDGQYLYALRSDGNLDKLELLTGEKVAGTTLEYPGPADALVLDTQYQRLFVAVGGDRLTAVRLGDLSIEKHWPLSGLDGSTGTPVIVAGADPPLVVQHHNLDIGPTARWQLNAYRLDDLSDVWTLQSSSLRGGAKLTAGAARLFLLDYDSLLNVIDFAGNLRQSVSVSFPVHSAAVLGPDRVAAVTGGGLQVFKPALSDGPPQWVGTEGVRELTSGYDNGVHAYLKVKWDYAVDDNAEPVRYVIYYSAGAPPTLDPPYTGTLLVTDLPTTGTEHEYSIYNLELGTRYYVTVRAYDGLWDELPNVEQNTRYLANTPPWEREELTLGTDLPAGKIYFLRGTFDPAGQIHLLYNDEDTAQLTHVYGTTGNWESATAGLASWPAVAFEPRWSEFNERLYAGVVDTGGDLKLLARGAADTWTETVFADATPVANPQLSFVYETAPYLAYTEYINGSFPLIEEHYYYSRRQGASWDPVAPLDAVNYCGRDLEFQLDPFGAPLLAYQRGITPDPNRLTPRTGSLMLARSDGAGGFDLETVDSGANSPDSDCGKRARLAVDAAGGIHIAYLDLNASAADPTGQLRYAYYDGSAWTLETVHSFDLSFQGGSLQYTWGELGLALTDFATPVIGYLGRHTSPSAPGLPHNIAAFAWVRQGANDWHGEQLTDDELAFPVDREPCVFLIDSSQVWHLFYASGDPVPSPTANKLVHLYRLPLPPAP